MKNRHMVKKIVESFHRKITETTGFTSLQKLMIMMLVIVLALVGSYAFSGYKRSAYHVKVQNTVQRAYDAAADYMENVAGNDRLLDFSSTNYHYGGIVTMEQQEEILRSLYEGEDFEAFFEEYREKYRNVPIYYICLESKEAAEEDRGENPILSMLAYDIADENVTDNAFLVEYNGNTGEVLAVFYSEKIDKFTYEGDNTEQSNVLLRDEESLDEKWQGYCGIDLEDL